MTTQNKSLRSPFAPTEGGILISSTLHDDEWSAYGDRLLKSSRAASSHDAPDSFTVDLSRCVWADPCPLMSVLLYGNHIARKQATNVTIKVCLAKEVTPTNQFPVFFFKQGFASAIRAAGMTVADNNDNIILPSDDQEYLARDDVLAYPDPPVIRAAILNFNPSPVPSNLVPDFVNTLLDQAREAYDHIAHRSVYTGLFYRTQVVLEETIQNVVDHAYRKSSNTPSLMVFARYRKGFKQLDSTNIATWRASITREQNRCPFLKADYLEDKEGCIEIFVVDHGIGIAGSFEKSARTLDGRQALRTILQRIFTVGKSTKKGKRADAGGLTVIHNQMVPNRDYLRGYDSGTWFGVPGGLNRPNRKIDDHPVDTGETMPVGLAWTLRLGLRGDIAPSLPWPHPIGDCKKSLLSEFERFYQCSGDELTCDVIDSRINIPRLDLFQPTDHKDVVIWLPQPDLGKDDVRTFFDRICARLTSSLRWTIIIADLRTHEGTVFFDALNGTSKPSDAHIDRVCLITERVQLHLLSRRADSKERFEVLDHEEAALVETGVLSPSCNLKDILANLRFHDSKCIWDEINRTPHTYIPEWIKWGVDQENKNKYIFGYLDLEIARHSRVISQLARIGIERVVGLTQGTSDVLLEPVDAFVSDLCDNFNSLGDRYKHADAARAHIGSIFVTGRTIDTMQCGQAKDVFHLLRHPYVMGPQDEEATATVFVWKHEASLPPKPEKDSDIRFERVGTSHAISIKGSKHYTIPKKKNDGTYFAHRSPKELYEDIQRVRASTVRVGHWVYRNNHDILGLNMRLFVRDGFDRRNDLAWFLIHNLLVDAGVPLREFSPDLRERVKAHKARTRTNRPQRAIVVYPSHAITERTISRLLDALTETGRQNVVQRFVPVRRLRTTHKHMASLLSPQSETLLQQALSREPIKKVIVFDDGLVSGNTNRDLGNLIAQFTNLPIQTVVIVNRRREPGAGAASSITQQYWRLDLPRLGNKQSCLLCRALEDIQTFRATAVTSQRGKARLQNWLDSWRGVDPNREWSGTGLRPLKLAKTIALQVGKTIGSPPAEGDRVQIDWSTALSVFDAELTAMTGLDDHIHRLLAKVTPLDPAVETELLTTHLLLFWNDIPPKIRTGICMRLISLVCRTEVPDLRTSLASLVLCAEGLRQGNVFEDRLLAYLDRDGIILANICFDATILFAYLYSKHILTSTKFYRSVRLLSTPRHSPARAYNDLYFETRGPVGNPHILPLQQLADGQVPPELYQRVRAGALDQLDKLENLLSCLDVRQARPSHALEWHSGDKPPGEATKARGGFELLRSFGVDAFQEKEEEDRYDRRKGKLLKKLGDLRETLINDIGGHYFRTEADIRMRSRGLDVCKEVMRLLSEFRKTFFFLEFSKDELRRGAFESYFIDPLYEYLGWDAAILVKRKEGKTFSKPALVCNQAISGTIPLDLNISIVCDSAVVRTFRDLLLNTGYAQTKEGEECSNASIGTSFLPDRVEITLSNSCSRLAADVIIDADKSYKWAAFQEIGGSVTYRQVGATEVAVVMAVPYAGFCTGE